MTFWEELAELIEQGLADLYIAHEKSTLRNEPDREWADDFVYDTYSRIVKQEGQYEAFGNGFKTKGTDELAMV